MNTNTPDVEAALQFGATKTALQSHPAWDRISWGVSVLQDMAVKRLQYGSLTPKQAAFAVKLHSESLQKMKWAEERAEQTAKRIEAGIRAPQGRTEITGTIIVQKLTQGHFGAVTKCLVELPDGAKVWGNQPSGANVEKGDKVIFVATFKPSDNDPTFGFFNRPHNWRKAA